MSSGRAACFYCGRPADPGTGFCRRCDKKHNVGKPAGGRSTKERLAIFGGVLMIMLGIAWIFLSVPLLYGERAVGFRVDAVAISLIVGGAAVVAKTVYW